MFNGFIRCAQLFFAMAVVGGCSNKENSGIKEINIGLSNNNELKIKIDVTTNAPAKVYVEYWQDSLGVNNKYSSLISKTGLQHQVLLCNIIPETNYSFNVVTIKDGTKTISKNYTFKSRALPLWLQDMFIYRCNNLAVLPAVFKEGLMLINKRETPGVVYIVDYKGRLRWYHMIDGTGFKVTHFTKDNSILSILGKSDEPTSYGSEILEINLLGDTLLHLKKGQGDFNYTIHHEILKKSSNEIITLIVDKKIMDLSSIGGSQKDTVNGDGILIMNAQGKKLWQWSVFDAIDPLKDKNLLKNKKDWMHANSLNYDKDSNFIISFYNNGQIWKLNARTGQVMWKLGKGGTVTMQQGSDFSQAHAVHINPSGSLMFFDNGVEKQQSEVFAFKINEQNNTASTDLHFKLPKAVYNERMGSAYMINDSLVLCCCSKRHITVLANKQGVLLWTLETGIPPYRTLFLKKENVALYLQTESGD